VCVGRQERGAARETVQLASGEKSKDPSEKRDLDEGTRSEPARGVKGKPKRAQLAGERRH